MDQERSRGYRDNTPKPIRADEPRVQPVPADTARALVFGEAPAAPKTEAKAEQKKTEPEAKAEADAKTEAPEAAEDHL